MSDLLIRLKDCLNKLSQIVNELESIPPKSDEPLPAVKHGKNDCEKKRHDVFSKGYMHDVEYDGPYDISGIQHCGRCHKTL